jgi:large subunit ribosomal protein L30
MAKLKVTLIKSAIGYPEDQKRTVQALGLKRINCCVEFDDSRSVRGMITKVRHLVKVETTEGTQKIASGKQAKRTAAPIEEKA